MKRKSDVPSHCVWLGNGFFMQGGNRKLFTGSEDECKKLISKIADRYTNKGVQLYYKIEGKFLINDKNRYLYGFVASVEA